MTPPVAPVDTSGPQPAVSVCLLKPQILAKRADFLRAAQARRQGTPGFLLQARPRRPDEPAGPEALRVGFTCSKKVGNAVLRNRAKRRLRALAAEVLPGKGRAGWDYVLVGRPEATIDRVYADMLVDLARALDRVHDDSLKHEPRPYAPKGAQKKRGKDRPAPAPPAASPAP